MTRSPEKSIHKAWKRGSGRLATSNIASLPSPQSTPGRPSPVPFRWSPRRFPYPSSSATDLGVSMGPLHWIISESRRAGLEPPSRNKERGKSWDWWAPEVRALLDSGRPDVEIAAELGIVRSSVRRLRGKLRKETPGAADQGPARCEESARKVIQCATAHLARTQAV